MLHGPENMLAQNCFGITGETCEKTPYVYGKVIIAQGEAFCRYQGGEEIAPYVDGVGSCVVKYAGEELGQRMELSAGNPGAVYSFGVEIGASYAAKIFLMCLMLREIKKCIPLFSPEPLW